MNLRLKKIEADLKEMSYYKEKKISVVYDDQIDVITVKWSVHTDVNINHLLMIEPSCMTELGYNDKDEYILKIL